MPEVSYEQKLNLNLEETSKEKIQSLMWKKKLQLSYICVWKIATIQKSRRGDLPKGDDTYSISLFSKIGDKVEVGVKNLKKIFVSFFPHISL